MNIWPKDTLIINGKKTETIAPIIISASRATDIPAFYSNHFMEQLNRGYLYWTNPFNGIKMLISLRLVKLIVFWSKNPAPIIPDLRILDKMKIDYYFNFTLNNYENEGLEKKLPPLEKRISTFIALSEKIGKEKVIWRFDPVIILQNQHQEEIIDKILNLAERLYPFTEKLVFSFVDKNYKKVQLKFKTENVQTQDLNDNDKLQFALDLSNRIKKFNIKISTCSESMDLQQYGIFHNKCIDDELITRIFTNNESLMDFIQLLKSKNCIKDKGQRTYCGCIPSKDIGKYNTCLYNCTYCYALQSSIPSTKSISLFD